MEFKKEIIKQSHPEIKVKPTKYNTEIDNNQKKINSATSSSHIS